MTSPADHAIDGTTTLIGIVGDPIGQVKSPQILNPKMRRAGINAVLVPMHLPRAEFADGMRGLMRLANLAGLVITVPFKQQALLLCDSLGEFAKAAGVVNTMRRDAAGNWFGESFDGEGLARAVMDAGCELRQANVLLLGAGGAGRAIALAFAAHGARAITVFDIIPARSERLAERVMSFRPSCVCRSGPPDATGYELIVNATPVGMRAGDGLPAPFERLSPSVTVVDIVTPQDRTPFLRFAAASGCRTIDGTAMIEGQADTILDFLRLAAAP